MPSNINATLSTNCFSNLSLAGLWGGGAPSIENVRFNQAFASSLTGVFQTSKKELVALPESQQTTGGAVRDMIRADIMGIRNPLGKLTKKSTEKLMKATGTEVKLIVDLRSLSSSSARVIESLSKLIEKMEAQGMADFEIPKQLRTDVDDAIDDLKSVSKAIADIDKARPAPLAIALATLVTAVGAVATSLLLGLNRIYNTQRAATGGPAQDPSATAQPASADGASNREIAGVALAVAFGSISACGAAYTLTHRAPALRQLSNSLATYKNGLTGLKNSFEGPKKFADFVNTAHDIFYAKPASLPKLVEDDFPPGAFDRKEDDAASVESTVAAAVANTIEVVVGEASEGVAEDAGLHVVIDMADYDGASDLDTISQSSMHAEAVALYGSVSSLPPSHGADIPLETVVVDVNASRRDYRWFSTPGESWT